MLFLGALNAVGENVDFMVLAESRCQFCYIAAMAATAVIIVNDEGDSHWQANLILPALTCFGRSSDDGNRQPPRLEASDRCQTMLEPRGIHARPFDQAKV